MKILSTNRYDESIRCLLGANRARATRVFVGADGGNRPSFPVGIFGAIIAAGILGGVAATYFERAAARGYR